MYGKVHLVTFEMNFLKLMWLHDSVHDCIFMNIYLFHFDELLKKINRWRSQFTIVDQPDF